MRRFVVPTVVVASALAGCGSHAQALRLTVTPVSALVDTPFRVQVDGLAEREPVTVTVVGRSHLGKPWRAALTARADGRGHVDLRDRYLLAELRPVTKPASDDYLPWEQDLTVTARATGVMATAHARRILQPPSVTVAAERPERVGFYGDWFAPRSARRHTAVLLLGGSNGRLPDELTAYMLAARGYPVLALAYFREPGLPKELVRIPLEYFRHALRWMRTRPEVDPARVVTFGISRGGELSLILASMFPDLVSGAVSYVGADLALPSPVNGNVPAWTYRGKPVLVPIALNRIRGPVFAAGGGDDALIPSGLYVEEMQQELRGHDRNDVMLVYPHAGHALGAIVPNQSTPSTADSIYGPLVFGGSPKADEAAREDSWPRLLRFLAELDKP